MFEIRKAIPSDALGIAIVKAYTWKTTYTGLIPNELINTRIDELKNLAEKIKDKGYSSVIINCLQGNPSIEFYKHMGGSIISKRTDKIKCGIITEDILYFKI